MQPQPATLSQNNKPVVPHSHGLPSNKPTTQQEGTTPRPMTSEYFESPANTRVSHCARPTRGVSISAES
ncbi:hypothetical protein E2C01_053407 [Portunus trituberculatus]|uniref:Uncharacterized protein n=1 Tax=Portunus trituberculatus TaxID=210409 RepID=A0A5B7GQP9_PORTR|nr:hypothetical protein [Portunus trituberculatus]